MQREQGIPQRNPQTQLNLLHRQHHLLPPRHQQHPYPEIWTLLRVVLNHLPPTALTLSRMVCASAFLPRTDRRGRTPLSTSTVLPTTFVSRTNLHRPVRYSSYL